ncbi:unnamed protein product [Caenorhabditis bovis]|uniref:dolichyl-phosphate-mannose--protein mannosyltransferase n=1 Tax=Caenorhabditis bovis TaxID=2654633 RepID=A0A8S1EJV9_9PELO|nr:unnamed protein product [Caenorhabditis bovis]
MKKLRSPRKAFVESLKHHGAGEIYKILAIVVFAFVPFLPSINGDFVFDDAESIVNNPIVNGQESIIKIFSRDFWGTPIQSPHSHKSYRPLTTLTFWINRIVDSGVTGYHIVNIVIHIANSLLVYHLTEKIGEIFTEFGEVALPAATLFAVHPVHTEAVANITGRAELLMTFFVLISVIWFIQSSEDVRTFDIFLISLLSTFSKEQGCMIMPICTSLQLLQSGFTKKFRLLKLCFWFITISFLRFAINNFETAKFSKLDNPTAFLDSVILRGINYSYIWLYHLYLLILPTQLCFDYSMGCIPIITNEWDLRALSPALLSFIIIGSLLIISRLQNKRSIIFATSFGLLAFLPCTNLFFTVGFTIAERVLYLPSVGFCILCGIIYGNVVKYFKSMEVIFVSILLLAGSKTYKRSEDWKNELSLYASGLTVCPSNAKIHYNLAKVLGDNGKLREAEHEYWKAIKLNPTYEQALNNLGNILEKNGDSSTAELLLSRAVRLRPTFAAAWMNLGITQMNLNKFQESEKSFSISLKLRPESSHCLFNLGVLYQKTNREILAMETWKNATNLDPTHSRAWTNLFVVLDRLSMCSEVVHLSPLALKYVANESSVQMQIGACFAQEENYLIAEKHILEAIRLKPDVALYHSNLGVLYQRMGRMFDAKKQYNLASHIDEQKQKRTSNLRSAKNIFPRNYTD